LHEKGGLTFLEEIFFSERIENIFTINLMRDMFGEPRADYLSPQGGIDG
jgi:hypothetical protein